MKAFTILIAASIVAISAAQYPPYQPRGSTGSTGPTNSGPSQQSQQQSAQHGTNSAASSPAATVPTEVIRVLSSSTVQQELDITSEELSELDRAARSLQASTTSEDEAFTAVSKSLTSAQIAQLEKLMVQDLGYGALALSYVRSKLSLTDAQTTQITTLTSIQEAAKRAILMQSSNASAAVKSISGIADITNAALAKVLTAAQDSAMRKLASAPAAQAP